MHEYVSSLQPSYSYQSSDSTFTFNSVLRGKLLAVVFQVEHDFCSLLNAGGFSNLKNPRAEGDHVKYWGLHFWFTAALLKPRIPLYSHSLLSPIWGPLVSRCIGLRRASVHVHAVGHHEGGVESNTKLTNDGAAGLHLVLKSVQKRLQWGESYNNDRRSEHQKTRCCILKAKQERYIR